MASHSKEADHPVGRFHIKRYYEAHRNVQGLTLRVTELQLRSDQPTSAVKCDIGDLPLPNEREQERLKKVLTTEIDEDAITRPTYRVQYDRPEPTTIDEDRNYLAEVRRDPYLAEGLRCAGYEDLEGLVA
jgi:hypothetical protein